MKSLQSELKLQAWDWADLLPLVQSVLNHTPANRLGGVAPVTAFTALPATTPMTSFLHPESQREMDIGKICEEQQAHIHEVQAVLEQMHKKLVETANKKRTQARDRHNKKLKLPNFIEGDFVLVGQVASHHNKLAITWKGPSRVVRALNDHTFEVQQLVEPYAITTHHGSRLQLYRERQREVTEDLLDAALFGDGGHLVQKLVACRYNTQKKEYEIQVQWAGLDPLEASWEPATVIYEDVPVLVERLVQASVGDGTAQSMWKALTSSTASKGRGK